MIFPPLNFSHNNLYSLINNQKKVILSTVKYLRYTLCVRLYDLTSVKCSIVKVYSVCILPAVLQKKNISFLI